jgi:polyhydroxybutyrate depolymerase
MNQLIRETRARGNRSAVLAIPLAAALVFGIACQGSGGAAGGSGGGASGRGGSGTGGALGGTGIDASGSGGTAGTGGMTPGGAGTGGAATGGSVGTGGGDAGAGGQSVGSGGSGGTGSGGRAGAGGRSDAGGASGGGGRVAAGGSGGSMPTMGCGTSDWLKTGRASIDVSGTMREYIVRVPDNYDTSRPYKLIFGFHARGGNATQVAGSGNNDYYGLYARAGSSAIFVAPEGLDAGWRNTDGRDIAFVKAMLAHFSSKLCFDQRKIFSVGFSFGGMMSDAIGCAMADVFRAIAPMAGGLPNAEHPYSGCDQVNMHPIAVWMAHGDNDTTVPLADGKAALDIFVKRAQCQPQTMPVTPSPCVSYQGCLPDYPIHFCQFSGGHSVPSFASQAIWAFFNQF